ncbi:MAG: VWA domain-containing protein [Candidatus Marinimicrobia bacterium]|jgi:Ca-activated chloride channel family protein|nr:VWA domain-containing protein [Candidatus Neomarinimicrobiota bacterium]MBT3617857.1 VWA domain-containing protein [Candidatus Neomarinimicrobiota bacterium]MBT3828214.1 VWA domain-containing protein [Candidatus Neomarinimicrobiota bacterium]MBT3997131.1 VWA domain-containing protein [Candidatus Neomarinimicrobiota bacterium]MBT4280597.1 VWA domain-containing protein [Candidatus Neomarinimicrobiota bacterium]
MIAFRHPIFLLILIPIAGLMLVWLAQNRKRTPWLKGSSASVQKALLSGLDENRKKRKGWFFAFSLMLLIFAVSGPQIGIRLSPVERKGIDLVFAIDVSNSMNAEDVKPSRLEKAKYEISQVIRRLKGDRVAMIVYAGVSHFYLPLTTDYEAAQLFLENIDTGMIPTQGTSLSSALNTAISGFQEESQKHKVVILVSDGEDHEGEAVAIAEKATKNGMTIHTVGVGTLKGSLIPVPHQRENNMQYKRDRSGKLVTTMLNEGILKDLAEAGNGIYTRFDNRQGGFNALLNAVDDMEKKTFKTFVYSEFEDRYQIFTALSMLFWIAGFVYPTSRKRNHDQD